MKKEHPTTRADAGHPEGGLLIVWHSRTGGSEQLANAAREGARDALLQVQDAPDGATGVQQVMAGNAQPPSLLAAGGYLFVCPENLAAISGQMKEFFDRCYYPLLERIAGRPYACIVCAGSDGSSAARQIARIATGWRLREAAPAFIVCTNAQSPHDILAPKTIVPEALARAREIGARLAAGIALGIP